MKSTHKTIRFNYKKLEDPFYNYELWQYYGVHPKKGRLHIDTKRFKKMMQRHSRNEFLFEGMFKNRTTAYLIPAKIKKYDYKINIIRDYITRLSNDWFSEYKQAISKIKTPNEVYERARLDYISETTFSDDIPDLEVKAFIKSIKRQITYGRVIRDICLQFICKFCIEVDRYLIILLKTSGYNVNRFDMKKFYTYTSKLAKKRKARNVKTIDTYKDFDLLHKVYNFLKHNNKSSYNKLKRHYPNNVASIKNGKTSKKYENGMFAGDWIILEDDYIDALFKKITSFFEEYCLLYFGEDIEESKWNYDDFFKNVCEQIKDDNDF